jgi:8-hydroxy-5-deazaflavin:NADPH oxidoreductase
MSIAIVGGTGDEGFGLALRLARAGEHVIIGSRDGARGRAAAEKAVSTLGGDVHVEGAGNEDAVAGADVVLVTVPFAGQADTYRSLKDAWRPGTVVCDCTSPLATAVGGRPWQVIRPWQGSAAEQAQALLPNTVRLVSGFQTVSGDALQHLDHEMDGEVLLAGAEAEAKATVGALVEKIPNLRWVDAGALAMARVIEPLTAILVSVNRAYGIRSAGIGITGRDAWGTPPPKPTAQPPQG